MHGNPEKFGTYTHWPGRKTFKEEKSLVIKAFENNEEDKLREYLNPLVRYWAEIFKRELQADLADEELQKAGFTHLKLVVRKYYEKIGEGKVGYKFSTYFEWFIRQGILEYFLSEDSASGN